MKKIICLVFLLFATNAIANSADYVQVNRPMYNPYPQTTTTYVNYGYNAQGQYVPTSYSTYTPAPALEIPQAKMITKPTYNDMYSNNSYNGYGF